MAYFRYPVSRTTSWPSLVSILHLLLFGAVLRKDLGSFTDFKFNDSDFSRLGSWLSATEVLLLIALDVYHLILKSREILFSWPVSPYIAP